MFKLINGHGIEMTFENGITVIIRMGVGVGDHAAIATDVPDAEKSVMDVEGNIQNSKATVTIVNPDGVMRVEYGNILPDQLPKILKVYANAHL